MKKDWKKKAKSMFLSEEKRKMYAKYAREIDQKPGAAIFMSILVDMINRRTKSDSLYPIIGTNEIHHIIHIFGELLRLPGDIHRKGDIVDVEKTPKLVDGKLFKELFQVYGRSIEGLSLLEWLYVAFAVFLATPRHAVKHD
jgi:hypothetical protein